MNKVIVALLFAAISIDVQAQNYLTRNGSASFFSHTALEDIKAQNNEVASVINKTTGDVQFKIAIKSFQFSKKAMQDHFNGRDYMDSEKFPKAMFKGKITNLSVVDFSKDGTYTVNVQGDLTIKNVTKNVSVVATITIKSGVMSAMSTFKIKRKDYDVIGESFVQKKIAEEIEINLQCTYEKQ
jgi:polyisoprenoid-binding protein YceI